MSDQAQVAEGAEVTAEVAKKRATIAEKDYDVDTKLVSFDFVDGTSYTLGLDELQGGMVTQLALHGLIQKAGDSYSGVKDLAEAKEAVKRVFDQLKEGKWSSPRGEGEGKPRIGELAQAISRVTGKPIEEITQTVATADDAKRKGWRAVPAVQAAIAEIRAEKARAAANAAGAATLSL